MENNRVDKADRIVIGGSIRAVSDYKDVEGIGFELTLTKHGSAFASSQKELLNKILTPVLFELAREEELK